jgi:hypothetical protein
MGVGRQGIKEPRGNLAIGVVAAIKGGRDQRRAKEVAMIRVIRWTGLGTLVLTLGLGPIGCGGEMTTTTKDKDSRKTIEQGMRKMQEQHRKDKGVTGAPEEGDEEKDKSKEDKAKEDRSKTGDKDKDTNK